MRWGEGHHVYKINGMYYILSADYSPMGRMQCARSKSIWGPYETCVISEIISGKMTFADAALKYSKDYLSGANGGSLGYAFPEAYVGPFAKMVETTPQGTISAPFKSEFGWHILEVTGSRDGDKTEDAYRQKAYEQIVNSQLQDATKDWVKALRKNADIQYFDK